MMVFLALPALQRSQRDTQRRDDMSQVVSQLQQYQANNRGKVPTNQPEADTFLTAYLNMGETDAANLTFLDPDGQAYGITFKGSFFSGTTPLSGEISLTNDDAKFNTGTNAHKIHYYTGAKCDGEKVVKATGSRNAAIQYKLEGAGVYCGNI